MGLVHLPRDPVLDRRVASKLLPAGLAAEAAFRERFRRGAGITAGLSHPHVVVIWALRRCCRAVLVPAL